MNLIKFKDLTIHKHNYWYSSPPPPPKKKILTSTCLYPHLKTCKLTIYINYNLKLLYFLLTKKNKKTSKHMRKRLV